MQKIKNIEFLRILMILGIVMLHAFSAKPWSLFKLYPEIELYTVLKNTFAAANNGVEGFFIISGFFFLLTFKPSLSFFEFIKSKYFRLAPVVIFASIIGMIAAAFHYVKIKWVPTIFSMFLLNNVVYSIKGAFLPATWFVSALMTAFVLYFCLKKFVRGRLYWVILSVLTCLGYTILTIFRNGYFTNPTVNLFGFLSVGFLRAISGIGLGVLLGEAYKKYRERILDYNPNKWVFTLITVVEAFLFCFVIWWLAFKHQFIYHGVFVLAFVMLFVTFVCQKGAVSKFFNKDWSVMLGKYSYSIYVTHVMIFKLISSKLWIHCPELVQTIPVLPVFVDFSLVIILGILTYHYIEKPCAKYLTERYKNN